MNEKKAVRNSEKMISKIFAESQLREAGYVMPEYHFHPYFELFYVESGGCRFLIDNNMYDLHAGDFLLIPPQTLHYTRYLFGPCRRDAIFFREEDVSGNAELLPHGRDFFSAIRIFQVPEAHREQAALILSRLLTEEKISDVFSADMQRTLLWELFLFCARMCTFLQDAPANIHTTDRQILTAAKFMSEHYAEPVTAADIAAAAGFSPNYLSRKFRDAAGIGIHQYLTLVRMQHAALELVSTRDSITEVAFRCGFSDSSYFKDAFKKIYGVSPREYRKTGT